MSRGRVADSSTVVVPVSRRFPSVVFLRVPAGKQSRSEEGRKE